MRVHHLAMVGLLAALSACTGTAVGAPDAGRGRTSDAPTTAPTAVPAAKVSEAQAKRIAKAAEPAHKELSGYRDATQPPIELDDPTVKKATKCLQVTPTYLARADRTVFVKGKHSLLVQADVYSSAAGAEKYFAALESRGSHCLQEISWVDRTLTKVDFDSEQVSVAGSSAALAWWAESTNKVGKVGRKVVIHTTTYVLQVRVGQTVVLVTSNSYGTPKVSRSQAVHVAEQAVGRILAAK